MHLGDSIFIFLLALVLFGPKKLPEMARQIGKLMAEFRRASNDFRLQIDEELRAMEREEQQKKQEAERLAAPPTPSILSPAAAGELTAGSSLPADEPSRFRIMPPALGEPVSAASPYAVSGPSESACGGSEPSEPSEPTSAQLPSDPLSSDPLRSEQDHVHPLLRVEFIPVDPHADANQPTGMAAAEANAARLTAAAIPETEQAPVHNG